MATGTRGTNTFAEGLRKLLGDMSELKLAPDSDLPFVIQLETMILQKLKGGADDALSGGGQSMGMGGMDPSMGAPAGIGGSPAPPPGMGSPAGTPGLMQGPPMMQSSMGGGPAGNPNADELRRALFTANTSNRLQSLTRPR